MAEILNTGVEHIKAGSAQITDNMGAIDATFAAIDAALREHQWYLAVPAVIEGRAGLLPTVDATTYGKTQTPAQDEVILPTHVAAEENTRATLGVVGRRNSPHRLGALLSPNALNIPMARVIAPFLHF